MSVIDKGTFLTRPFGRNYFSNIVSSPQVRADEAPAGHSRQSAGAGGGPHIPGLGAEAEQRARLSQQHAQPAPQRGAPRRTEEQQRVSDPRL